MEQNRIKVSVIIPIYNAEEYIRECIYSVQKQSLKVLEILCVDDGSSDSTVEIVKALQKKDQRIVLLHQDHGGAGKARNTALSIAKGAYVSFLDADDLYVDSFALESMVNACEENHVLICGSLRKEWIDGEERDIDLFHGKVILEGIGCRIGFEEFQEDFHFQSFIFERLFLIGNQIFFPEYLRYEDPPFFLRAMIAAGEFWVIPLTLYRYRGGHLLKKVDKEQIRDTLTGICDNLQLAAQNKYEILFDRLIERLNFIYYENIENNLSGEVLAILLKISEIDRLSYKRKINILENLYQMPIWFSDLKMQQQDLWGSYEVLCKIVKIIQGPGFKIFFDRRHIRSVTVYGLGMYGEILVNGLRKEHITIVAGIDAKVQVWNDLKVIKPDDEIPECDAIIVSPIKSEEIISMLQQKELKVPIITFKDMVEILEKWMENINMEGQAV